MSRTLPAAVLSTAALIALTAPSGAAAADLAGATSSAPASSTAPVDLGTVTLGPPDVAPEPAPKATGDEAQATTGTRLPTTDEPTKKTDAADGVATAPVLPPAAVTPVSPLTLEEFRIPLFLLPIYQAAGVQYGVPWELLAAINGVETDYGRNVAVSSAGATGWMQFMPATWRRYGVDADRDGHKNPNNPVDAIFAAARYLRAAGVADDQQAAVLAYNHAQWYADDVLARQQELAALPPALTGALTGLADGVFPVRGRASFPAPSASNAHPWTDVRATPGTAVVATQGGRVVAIGHSRRLGHYVRLRDAYGNTYTYANLGSVASTYPVPRPVSTSRAAIARELDLVDRRSRTSPKRAAPSPQLPDSALLARALRAARGPRTSSANLAAVVDAAPKTSLAATNLRWAAATGGLSAPAPSASSLPATPRAVRHATQGPRTTVEHFTPYVRQLLRLKPSEVRWRKLRPGAEVTAGTVLGRVGERRGGHPAHLRFTIRPVSAKAPTLDARPILQTWKLLEQSRLYRVKSASGGGIGQALLMDRAALSRLVLADPRITIYDCGRRDIRVGAIDRRVLATLELLADAGLHPTVSALQCGHSLMTTSGNVSEHSTGDAVDIAAINGVPILGHQGDGSITDLTIRRLLTLQGPLAPHQIISLMTFPGAPSTMALPDHADHIHVGFRPDARSANASSTLTAAQWKVLSRRLGSLAQPRIAGGTR